MDATLSPMLCGKADIVPTGKDWILEPKFDGWRLVCHRTDEGVQVFAGRDNSDYTGKLPYIEQALEGMLLPDSVVDGEIIGTDRGEVASIFTQGFGVHKPSVALPALSYVIFDITRMRGDDLRAVDWRRRRDLLEAHEMESYEPFLQLSPTGESTQEAHEAMLKAGMEGSVCKRVRSTYVNGRSNNWIKIKPQSTDEAKIIGFKPGKKGGRWDGKVGAFEVEMLETAARTTVKCGTDARHHEATDHPEKWLNVVIELKHHGLGATGVPLHPQFLRRRDDRSADEPITRPKEAPRVSRPSPRNYGAMKNEKLLRVMRELESGGDAAQRAMSKGFDPASDLAIVRDIAQQRGLETRAA